VPDGLVAALLQLDVAAVHIVEPEHCSRHGGHRMDDRNCSRNEGHRSDDRKRARSHSVLRPARSPP
jgi:hypothetical protein